MTSHFAMTPSTPRMSYERAGNAGSNVLLVMGFGFPGAAWRAQIDGLSKAHQVCAYDNVGTGRSEPVTKATSTMDALAGDGFRMLETLGWSSAHIIGVSMGGMIAQHMAANAPERVRSLSLIATSPGGPFRFIPTRTGLSLFLRANTSKSDAERAQHLQHLLYTPHFLERVSKDELAARTRDTVGQRASARTLTAHLSAVLRHDAREKLRSVHIPTLVVRPTEDLLVKPKRSDELMRLLPNAECIDVPAGHGCIFESAQDVNRALLNFLAKVDATS
jgi:pimeloyl-ACP methyl ester carboxylesterase